MGRNLGPLNIKDTYEGLVQISGSQLTDGSGSLIPSLDISASFASQAGTSGFASQAGTAGFASQAGTSGFATSASYAATASVLLGGISLQRVLDTGNTATEDINLTGVLSLGSPSTNINIQNKGATNTLLIDGANTKSVVIGGSNVGSKQSIILGYSNNVPDSPNGANSAVVGRNNNISVDAFIIDSYILGALNNISGAGTGRVVIGYDNDATVGSYGGVFAGTNNTVAASFGGVIAGANNTSGHARSVVIGGTGLSTTKADEVVVPSLRAIGDITGSAVRADDATFTSASIGHLTTVTGSAVIIGDAYVIVNSSDVTRYAGIKVYESGSVPPTTASLEFDSQTNDWFYSYTGSDPTNFGAVMFGPEYGTKGSPIYPTANTLVKGNGGHHLIDSSITDDGTDVVVSANISASGFISASTYYGDGSNLSGIVVPSTLQDVTTNGNQTTNDIIITGSLVAGADNLTFTGTDSAIIASATGSLTGGTYKVQIGAKQSNNTATNENNVQVGTREATLSATGVGNGQYSAEYSTLEGSTAASVIIGGYGNYMNNAGYAAILGGESNQVTVGYSHVIGSISSGVTGGSKNIIVGGESNSITSGTNSGVFAGNNNSVTGDSAAVLAGAYSAANGLRSAVIAAENSTVSGQSAIAIGGYGHNVGGPEAGAYSGDRNTINARGYTLGGHNHTINADANYSAIIAGEGHTINNSVTQTVILGGDSITATANDSVYVPHLVVSGSVSAYDGGQIATSSSLGTGSLLDNVGTPTPSEAIEHIVYLTQAEYDALSPDANTMYVISGSTDIVQNLVVSGSMIGAVNAISVASSTGSLDCSTGNYFTLGLANAADTRLEASNIQIGQTINIKITNNATAAGTISFGPEFKFEGGTAFTATAATSAVDIITAVSFDGTSLQVVGVKNFS